MKLSEGLKYVLLSKKTMRASKWTIRDYKVVLREFIVFLGDLKVEDVGKQDAFEFIESLFERELAETTVNIRIRYLRSYFNILIEDELVSDDFKNPMDKIKTFSEAEFYNREIPLKVITKLLRALDIKTFTGRRNYLMILTMLGTGIRPSELVRLEESDLKDSHIVVRKEIAKSKKMRILPVPDEVETEMYKYQTIKGDWGGGLLFPNNEGEIMTTHALGLAIRRLASSANIEEGVVYPYAFRHTFAINYLRGGGDLFRLQKILGHATLEMTRRYVTWDIEDLYVGLDKATLVKEVVKLKVTKRRRR